MIHLSYSSCIKLIFCIIILFTLSLFNIQHVKAEISVPDNDPKTDSVPYSTCWRGDSNCPSCNSTSASENWISYMPMIAPSRFKWNLLKAKGQILRYFYDLKWWIPQVAMHISLNYFCCHTKEEKKKMISIMKNVEWEPIQVRMTDFGCNVNDDESTVYLHTLPDEPSQQKLNRLMKQFETAIESAGIDINFDRTQAFHTSVAWVSPSFPTDDVIQKINRKIPEFGTVELCWVLMFPHVLVAKGASKDSKKKFSRKAILDHPQLSSVRPSAHHRDEIKMGPSTSKLTLDASSNVDLDDENSQPDLVETLSEPITIIPSSENGSLIEHEFLHDEESIHNILQFSLDTNQQQGHVERINSSQLSGLLTNNAYVFEADSVIVVWLGDNASAFIRQAAVHTAIEMDQPLHIPLEEGNEPKGFWSWMKRNFFEVNFY
eukprot:gb/GECH01013955.1/.p1 GENE.gb/GECH01013955.1/~~gb/GECH01013955.1/.p1  ORF type:complete len:432 (+),score=80.40 gb/GECH01013955.1/:1-1296(+)